MTEPTYKTPPSVAQLAEAEEVIQAFWEAEDIFGKSLAKPAPNGNYVFFEGPPTANNVPHVGHALTRTIKDLLPRFKTMRGYHVARKAGWDTHGLPVEIAIEKELGFTDKNAIEQYGIEAFNKKCFDSVRKYEREWVTASERLGFWLDYDNGYFTFTNTYVESVWWLLKQMFDKDMLYEGHKVLPYCPLCGTTHSSHEVAQAYQDVKDPSVTVGLHAPELGDDVHLLVWTTTPWTLPSNMAACVHPDHEYVMVASKARPGRHYVFAKEIGKPVEELIDNKPFDLRTQPVLKTWKGSELEGVAYNKLFDFTEDEDADHRVVVDKYVTLDSGTGLVHVAPAFGEDDHRVGKAYGLTMYCAMRPDGKFKADTGELAGKWFKDADIDVLTDLKHRGQLVRSEKYEHSYPHCWRHGTPLYYFATSSWFVRTTQMKQDLVDGNQTIDWTPDHIRDGRFGKWLDGVVDWALSRKRYWGTPLPIWRCTDCGKLECMGSYAQLFERAGKDLPADPYDTEQWNPHRPYVDDVTLSCADCSSDMQRVTEVIDCWFDAGSMPFAQHHYPFTEESRQLIDGGDAFPADFISEAVDQTRGWFYTLHVISTFAMGKPAFKSCVVLGHVLDEQGRKMSKSWGNVVAPGPIIDQFGADAFRWFFYRSNPTQPSRFGPNMVRESLKSFLLPLLNAWSFFTIYAEIDGFRPEGTAPAFEDRAPLDRWVLSSLKETVDDVTAHLEGHRLGPAATSIESFVDGLTNWYIRRSRRRFWKGEDDADKRAAQWTLWEVLTTLSKVIAPFCPFVADRLHQDLVRPFDADAPLSVHLADWPTLTSHDAVVLERMEAARRVVTLGHSARQGSSVGVRQPLAAATIVSVSDALLKALEDADTADVVRDELNVKELAFAQDRGAYVTYTVKPNFRTLGRRMGKRMPLVAKAVAQLDAGATVSAWEADGKLDLTLSNGDVIELSGEDLDVRIQQREGTASAYDDAALVALDVELNDALILEGVAREVINRIQGARKDRDLAYDDRIAVRWDAGGAVAEALAEHTDLVAGEVLAVRFEQQVGLQDGLVSEVRDETLHLDFDVVSA
ncbi:MAG: isoleucine--tRNA ligase [Proteobacteria bacterium]|nr:isoleucine--tRNA ligase [Pseudomonadota bacterium]